jgi:hypothetical protein
MSRNLSVADIKTMLGEELKVDKSVLEMEPAKSHIEQVTNKFIEDLVEAKALN